MINFIGGLNLLNKNDVLLLESCLHSWYEQSIPSNLVLSVYIHDMIKNQASSVITKYPKATFFFSDKKKTKLEHYKYIYESHLIKGWVGFTDLGIWEKHRVESFKKCMDGLNQFTEQQQKEVKFFRISRTVFTDSRLPKKIDNTKINKLLEEGKIIGNDNDGWGQIIEYMVQSDILETSIHKLIEYDLVQYENADRYLLKWINNQNYKFINLNMNKIPIHFWMYFYPENENNSYFKPIPNTESFEKYLVLLKEQDFFPKSENLVYNVGTNVSTPYGPGCISKIENGTTYHVNVKWEDTKTDVYKLPLSQLLRSDPNKVRRSLYNFVMNLLNNIDLYLTYFVFNEENPPDFNHFLESIHLFIKTNIEEHNKEKNTLEKLFSILDFKEKIPDINIYDNQLSKDIFRFMTQQPDVLNILKI